MFDTSGRTSSFPSLGRLKPSPGWPREKPLQFCRPTGLTRLAARTSKRSFSCHTGEMASNIQQEAFYYLDTPVTCVGAKNGIAPQSRALEAVSLSTADHIVTAAKSIL